MMINYKLNTYERNDIYMGVKLFITHETERNPLDTKVLDKMLRELFYTKVDQILISNVYIMKGVKK